MTAVLAPRFFDDLWAMLNDQPEATLMAGGTDLLVRRRAGLVNPRTIVLLEGLDALAEISLDNGELVVGSGATHSRILNSPLIRTNAPLLAMALAKVGGPQIRNMGTIGGNLCTASPAGDSLPALHVLGARVELLSQNARRVMNLDEFILGPGKTALRPREILTRILVPPTRHFQVQHFEKVGQRKAMAIAVVSLASLFRLGPRGLIEKARLALGSVGPTIIRPAEAEASLIGRKLSPAALAQAARLVRKAIRPIDDIRASAEYRRQTAGNLVMRLAENEYAKNFKKTDKLLCN